MKRKTMLLSLLSVLAVIGSAFPAFTAYSSYNERSRIVECKITASKLKTMFADFVEEKKRFPASLQEVEFSPNDLSPYAESVDIVPSGFMLRCNKNAANVTITYQLGQGMNWSCQYGRGTPEEVGSCNY